MTMTMGLTVDPDPQNYKEQCDWNDIDVGEGHCDPFWPDVEGGLFSEDCFRDRHRDCCCYIGSGWSGGCGFTHLGVAGPLW